MAPKKRYVKNLFFTPVFHCWFWTRDPGWVKSGSWIRDKHPVSATVSQTFEKIRNDPNAIFRGFGEKTIHEKNLKQKSRDTVPIKRLTQTGVGF